MKMPKKEIKKGDIVGRKSYGKDIIFVVRNIIKTKNGEIAILSGIVERVEADSKIEDLELIEKTEIQKQLKNLEEKLNKRINCRNDRDKNYQIGIIMKNTRTKEKIITGKILHLDGDALLQKCNYMSADII